MVRAPALQRRLQIAVRDLLLGQSHVSGMRYRDPPIHLGKRGIRELPGRRVTRGRRKGYRQEQTSSRPVVLGIVGKLSGDLRTELRDVAFVRTALILIRYGLQFLGGGGREFRRLVDFGCAALG